MIVLSDDPETIWEPSVLKPTEKMAPLCAFCFSATKARDDESAHQNKKVTAQYTAIWGDKRTHPRL